MNTQVLDLTQKDHHHLNYHYNRELHYEQYH
jgi:hypothetical protein